MKKITFLSAFLFITLFAIVNNVYADTYSATNFYNDFDTQISFYESHTNMYDTLISYYTNNYSSSYPYYSVRLTTNGYELYCLTQDYTYAWTDTTSTNHTYSDTSFAQNSVLISIDINLNISTYSNTSFPLYSFYTSPTPTLLVPFFTNIHYKDQSYGASSSYDIFSLPQFTSQSYDTSIPAIDIEDGMTFPSYLSLYDGSYEDDNLVYYEEVDLNDYAYVTLSLIDYSVSEPFTTNLYVKGQLCATPVYDYGMKEKTSYYSGYQVERCSPYYSDFTLNRFYILQQDLDNHAIFYLKAYDTTKPNVVKVDTRVFSITPISQENADNPSVTIDGRSYPTIPYNDLSSTATKSEEENYISGQVQNVFDVTSDSTFIDNIFSNPLQSLQSVWASILSMFSLIGSFITLLPPILQSFLYTAFVLGLAIGIIKILL